MFAGADIPLLLYIGLSETFMVHFAFSAFMRRNDKNMYEYLAVLAVYLIITSVDALLDMPVFYVLFICYVLIVYIAFRFFDSTLEERLVISFVYVAVNYSMTIFATTLVFGLDGNGFEGFPSNLAQTFESQTFLTIMVTCSIFLMEKLKRFVYAPATIAGLSFLTPLLMVLLIINEFYMISAPDSQDMLFKQYISIALLLLFTAIILYMLALRIGLLKHSLEYSATLEQMLSVQQKYYSALQEHQRELRRIYHDTKGRTRTMLTLLDSGLNEEAAEYARSMLLSARDPAMEMECDNQLLDALLSDRLGPVRRLGVEVSSCIMVPPVLEIDNVDLCILVENMLDNAVEACERMQPRSGTDAMVHRFESAAGGDLPRRYIDVDIRMRGPFLCLYVENSFDGCLKCEKGVYLSVKPDPESHGLGITHMLRIVEKYHGRLKIEHSANVFSVTALLEYPDDELLDSSSM